MRWTQVTIHNCVVFLPKANSSLAMILFKSSLVNAYMYDTSQSITGVDIPVEMSRSEEDSFLDGGNSSIWRSWLRILKRPRALRSVTWLGWSCADRLWDWKFGHVSRTAGWLSKFSRSMGSCSHVLLGLPDELAMQAGAAVWAVDRSLSGGSGLKLITVTSFGWWYAMISMM